MRPTLVAATIVIGTSCASPAEPTLLHPLSLAATDSTLQLANSASQSVFYFIYERQAAALINWAPCVEPSRCQFLPPGGQASVPYSDIGGYGPGKTEAILWWWYAVPGPADGSLPGEVHSIVVKL